MPERGGKGSTHRSRTTTGLRYISTLSGYLNITLQNLKIKHQEKK
jgi:hypothetical protein